MRVPEVRKAELTTLAAIGALNFIAGGRGTRGREAHRRDALWQIERAARRPGRLFEVADSFAAVNDPVRGQGGHGRARGAI